MAFSCRTPWKKPIPGCAVMRGPGTQLKMLGFTLVEIMIVIAIIGVILALLIPGIMHARASSQKRACINNLRVIDQSIQLWALEQKKDSTEPVDWDDILPYLRANNVPHCPAGGNYNITIVGERPTCTRVDLGHRLP